MNAPPMLQSHVANAQPSLSEDEGRFDLREYWDILIDSRWVIAAVTCIATAGGAAYAFLAQPVYEANLLIQVEDTGGGAKTLLGDAANFFDVKTGATAEIEILRSRMVLGQAVDSTLMYLEAKPKYVPLIGSWMARRSSELSDPGFFGFEGYVSGRESIAVSAFDVPGRLEASPFTLTARGGGRFQLTHPEIERTLEGSVGAPLVAQVSGGGAIRLLVTSISAKPGADFSLTRLSRLGLVEQLQSSLQLTEKGRQSGIIDATLQSTDAPKLVGVLNEIGKQYVRQNVERKSAEAKRTLEFLDVQLPQFKRQLDQAEEAYNKYRNIQGTVALDEEARLILGRSVDLQSKLLEAQQKRRELIARFTPQHPGVQTLDEQIRAWNSEIAALNGRIKAMPAVQQDALRLERDVKVNNELYQQLRNSALQLQLVREGKVGNVRVIDEAVPPRDPVKPRRSMVLGLALLAGLLAGVLLSLARAALFRGIRNAQEIEAATGLNVFSTIPLSPTQEELAHKVSQREPGTHLLALMRPQDPAIESLRSLRTALQFAMLQATNNRILITGATPGVGKSFVSANFAVVLAAGGKRVLLIDADLRRGYLNSYFGVPRERGLSEAVSGSLALVEAVHRSILPNLDFISTGVLPPNPAEVMLSTTFSGLLTKLSEQYDFVIIDTAPVLAAADTLGIATLAGTLLLVARAGETQLGELNESARRIAHAGKAVNGVLFNALDLTRRHYGRYGYKYGGYSYKLYQYKNQ